MNTFVACVIYFVYVLAVVYILYDELFFLRHRGHTHGFQVGRFCSFLEFSTQYLDLSRGPHPRYIVKALWSFFWFLHGMSGIGRGMYVLDGIYIMLYIHVLYFKCRCCI